ncbi:uncharacterized protein TNCV_506461 [Trichonephila clavipes]|nr:uncharacterized protein TNCV_506461 [Trichonephila clavipes]
MITKQVRRGAMGNGIIPLLLLCGTPPLRSSSKDFRREHAYSWDIHEVRRYIQGVQKLLRPMTLHSPTENSLAVLNHKIREANSLVQNVKLGGHQTCLSINRLWHKLCDMLRRLVETTAPGHHDCSIQE